MVSVVIVFKNDKVNAHTNTRKTMSDSNQYRLLLTTCADMDSAQQLAQGLLDQRLAACVSLLPQVQSWYVWDGKINQDAEIILFIKSTTARYAEIETYLKKYHPYDVPELLSLPIDQGLPAYLQWLDAAVTNDDTTGE